MQRRPALATRPVPVAIALALGMLAVACAPEPTTTPSAAPTQSATAAPHETPTSAPTGSPVAEACDPAVVAVRILEWQGGAGHRVALVELRNPGTDPCLVGATLQPQLVDGSGSVLIDGPAGAFSPLVTLAAGAAATTMVDAANYCGPEPAPPVSVAFVFPGSLGRVVAEPLSASDTSGVPPCSGVDEAASIEMQPWTP